MMDFFEHMFFFPDLQSETKQQPDAISFIFVRIVIGEADRY